MSLTTMLLIAIALGLLWALWLAWSGGALLRWWKDWSLRGAQLFGRPVAQVEPPQQARAHPAPGASPLHGNPHASQPERHRSGHRRSAGN